MVMMNKLILMSLSFLVLSLSFSLYAEECCPPADHPYDGYIKEGWQLYVRYVPCHYTTRRCVPEQIPDKKRTCTRAITKFRIKDNRDCVPEYTTALLCSVDYNSSGNFALDTVTFHAEDHTSIEPYEELEYYEVMDYKIRYKWVNEQHCKYVPQYYWKAVSCVSCVNK